MYVVTSDILQTRRQPSPDLLVLEFANFVGYTVCTNFTNVSTAVLLRLIHA